MLWLFILILAILAITGCLIASRSGDANAPDFKLGAMGIAVLLVLITAFMGIKNVASGHLGVESNISGVVQSTLAPGMHFVLPIDSVADANVQTQKAYFSGLTAFSEESQDIFGDVQVNYHLDPAAVLPLYRSVGADWYDKFVPGAVQQDFKEETVKYYTVDIAPHRPQIAQNLLADLRRDLEPHSIHVDNVYVWNIGYSKQFTQAIEAKQAASQRVAQAKLEAQQAVAVADGQRDAEIAKAQGQARANQLLNNSLNANILRYQQLQLLQGKVKVILVPNNGNLLDLGTLAK